MGSLPVARACSGTPAGWLVDPAVGGCAAAGDEAAEEAEDEREEEELGRDLNRKDFDPWEE